VSKIGLPAARQCWDRPDTSSGQNTQEESRHGFLVHTTAEERKRQAERWRENREER